MPVVGPDPTTLVMDPNPNIPVVGPDPHIPVVGSDPHIPVVGSDLNILYQFISGKDCREFLDEMTTKSNALHCYTFLLLLNYRILPVISGMILSILGELFFAASWGNIPLCRHCAKS